MRPHIGRLFFFFIALAIYPGMDLWSQCQKTGPYAVEPGDRFEFTISIDSIDVDDLSDPLQGLCAVSLEYEHQSVSNMQIELESPAGQRITLVGPIGVSDLTFFTQWNISFLPCGAAVDPDLDFDDTYSNLYSWGVLGEATGSYYPFSGCLEDFDTGPITGDWKVIVRDQGLFYNGEIHSITLFFCNPTGLECLDCAVPENTFSSDSLVVCSDASPYSPDLDTAANFDTSFHINAYLFQEGDTILWSDTDFLVDSLAFGTYEVCLWTMEQADSAAFFGLLDSLTHPDSLLSEVQEIGICAVNGDCAQLQWFDNTDTLFIDTILCSGESLIFRGDTLDTTGVYLFQDSSSICPQTLRVNLAIRHPMAQILTLDTLNCEKDTVVADASSSVTADSTRFRWETAGGQLLGRLQTYTFSTVGNYQVIVSDGICQDTLDFELLSDEELPEFEISGDTTITCSRDSAILFLDTIDPGASYFWVVDQDTSFLDSIVQNIADTIYFFAEGTNGCRDSLAIILTEDFRAPVFAIDTQVTLCPGDTALLSAVVDTAENYIFEWSGPDDFVSSKQDTLTDQAGTYILQVTHPETGCSRSDTLTLEESPLPEMPEINSDTLNCLQRSVLLQLDTVVSGWNYFWLGPLGDTLAMAEPEVDLAGRYILWVSDPMACSDSIHYEVPETINFPRYEIRPDTLGCIDESALLSVIFFSDSSGFNPSWEDPLGRIFESDSLVTSLPGSYIFRLSNGDFCETADTFLLLEDFTPFDHILQADALNCERQEAEITISGGTADFDFQWEGPDGFSATGDTLTVTEPGPYTVAVRSVNCFYERGIRVEVDTASPPVEFELLAVNCARDTGQLTFQNSNLRELSVFAPDSANVDPIPGFTYLYQADTTITFRLEGTNGCTTDARLNLPVDTLTAPITTFVDTFTCDQNQIQGRWQSGGMVSQSNWFQDGDLISTTDTFSTSRLEPLQLELEFDNACIFDTLIQLPVDTVAPNLLFSASDLTCDQTEYNLEADATKAWREVVWITPDNDSAFSTLSIPIQFDGEYQWQITGANGCKRSGRFMIDQDTTLAEVQVQDTLIPCDQDRLQLIPEADSSEWNSFFWRSSDGSVLSEWAPTVGEGAYAFVYQGDNGCVDSLSVEVRQDEVQATVSNIDSLYILDCTQRTDTLRPQIEGMPDATLWIRPTGILQVGSEIEIAEAGSYRLIIRERGICLDTLTVDVQVDTIPPVVTLAADTLSCNQPEVQAEVDIQASDPQFQWEGPLGFTSDEREPTLQRPGKYGLTITDENGCFTVDSLDVFADLELPEVNVPDSLFTNCDRPIVPIQINIAADETIEWWDDGQVVSTETQLEYPPGDYLTAAVTGANGCTGIDSIYLSEEPKFPQADWSLPILACDNLRDTIEWLGADGVYTYRWSGPEAYTHTGQQPVVSVPGLYTVRYTNDAQCETIDSLSVQASSQPPTFSLQSNDTLRCLDSTAIYQIILSNPAEYEYQWQALSGRIVSSSDELEASLQGPGEFVVTVQDRDRFCVSRDTFEIAFADPNEWPLAYQSFDQVCIEDTLRGIEIQGLDTLGVGPFTYILDGDTVESASLNNLQPGNYALEVYDRQGCQQETSFEVRDGIDQIWVDIGEDGDVNLGQNLSITPEVDLSEDEIDSWVWVVNTRDSCFQCFPFDWTIRGPTRIDYYLTTTGGCILTDQINLLPPIEELVFVPNVFSPNDDGVNDFFFIQTASAELDRIDEIQIFNRSGNLIFERRDFPPNIRGEGWNGMFRGQKQDPQVFTVLLKYTFENEQRSEVFSLTLVR